MSAIRVITAMAACAAMATPLWADVTLRSKRTETGFGGRVTEVTEYRKGLRVRTDSSGVGVASVSLIIDASTGRWVMLWHDVKSADIGDVNEDPAAPTRAGIPDVQQSVTPTGASRQIAGWRCTVHHVTSSIRYPQWSKEGAAVFILEGSMCLVKNGPGQADLSSFSRSPNAAAFDHSRMTSPKITDLGVPFSTDIRVRMGGDAITNEISRATTEVVSVSIDAIPDAVFEIPSDYVVRGSSSSGSPVSPMR